MPDERGNPTFFERLERNLYNPYTRLAQKFLPKDIQDSYLGAAIFGVTGMLDLPSEAVLGGMRAGVQAGKESLQYAKEGDVTTATLAGLEAVAAPTVGAMAGTTPVGLAFSAGSKAAAQVPGVAPVAKVAMNPATSAIEEKKRLGYPVAPADEYAARLVDLGWNAYAFHKVGQGIENMRAHSIQTPEGPRVVAEPQLFQKKNPLDADQTHVQKNYKEFDSSLTNKIRAVAYKIGDRIIPGEPGDVHAMLFNKMSKEDQDAIQMQYTKGEANSAGFVTTDGRFFTKHELLQAQKALAAREEALPKFTSTDDVYEFSKDMTFDQFADVQRRLANNEEILKAKLKQAKTLEEKHAIYVSMGLPVQFDREAANFYVQRHTLRNMGYAPEELDKMHGIQFDEFYKDRTTIRTRVQDQIKTAMPNVTPEQVDAHMRLMDEFAANWSKWSGKPATEWYVNRFGGKGGVFPATEGGEGLKQQEAGQFFEDATKNAQRAVRYKGKVYSLPGVEAHFDVLGEIPDVQKMSEKEYNDFLNKLENDPEWSLSGSGKIEGAGRKMGFEKGYMQPDGTFLTKEEIDGIYNDLYQKEKPVTAEKFGEIMGAKGMVEFTKGTTEVVIKAFKSADFSTLVHETSHVFRRDLSPDLMAEAETYLGVKEGKWNVEHEEKFARAFEKYLRDGQAPTPGMRTIFEHFKRWLSDIYVTVTGSSLDVKVTPDIRRVFDKMLGGEEEAAPKRRVIPKSTGTYGPE